jgi:cobalt-zinc-cadmium efflux system protein
MSHQHVHAHSHNHFHSDRKGNKTALIIALSLTSFVMVLELVGGIFSNSLALLSDAGHMSSDALSLFLSLVAIWFSAKQASSRKTYGFYRFEILAALFNGITLFLVSSFIIIEAYKRFLHPESVDSQLMMGIAVIGLLANLLSAYFLIKKGDTKNNLNLRSAYLHVLSDAAGSIGVIIAAILIILFDWTAADPIISILVSLLILKGAWAVVKQSIHILMEGTPVLIDQKEVEKSLIEIDGVKKVCDLHIWTITSGLDTLTCHLQIEEHIDSQVVLQEAIDIIEKVFKIEHITIQIETDNIRHNKHTV